MTVAEHSARSDTPSVCSRYETRNATTVTTISGTQATASQTHVRTSNRSAVPGLSRSASASIWAAALLAAPEPRIKQYPRVRHRDISPPQCTVFVANASVLPRRAQTVLSGLGRSHSIGGSLWVTPMAICPLDPNAAQPPICRRCGPLGASTQPTCSISVSTATTSSPSRIRPPQIRHVSTTSLPSTSTLRLQRSGVNHPGVARSCGQPNSARPTPMAATPTHTNNAAIRTTCLR